MAAGREPGCCSQTSPRPGECSSYLSWLAVALTDANEPEEAAKTASRMLDLAEDFPSEPTAERGASRRRAVATGPPQHLRRTALRPTPPGESADHSEAGGCAGVGGRSGPVRATRSAHTEHVRGSRRTCRSHPAFPVRRAVPDERIRASLKSVLDGFLIPRPVVGHRPQPPLPEQTPHLLEPVEIMRGLKRLIVLSPELRTM